MNTKPDTFGCIANTIKVSAGHYVDLLNPDPATIEIRSIAAALSKTCRFGGHSPKFYSVAEHCVHAVALAAAEGYTCDALTAVFLHDAAEAYVGDMVKPLKNMMPEFANVERRLESAIEKAFGIDFCKYHTIIKRFDRAMLKAEKIAMWPQDAEDWHGFHSIEDTVVSFQFWSPGQAEANFRAMARTLKLEF